MKPLHKKLRPLFKTSLVLGIFFLSVFMSGCSLVYDDLKDCDRTLRLKFVYEMNMSGGDGFPAQVHSVSVWFFDHETGDFKARYSDSGSALDKEGYAMDIKDLEPGNYDLIVWGGLSGNSSFTVPSKVEKKEDLTCRMRTETLGGDIISNSLLTDLFYGYLNNVVLTYKAGVQPYTVELIKDTNNINISLQHLSDDPLDASDFTIYMIDDNSYLNYNNGLIKSNQVIYYPWSTQSGVIDQPLYDINFIQAEISTSRLMSNQDPKIVIIDNDSGTTVYEIPIVQWAKELRSQQHLQMNDQEYLDREHQYDLQLLLVSENGTWKEQNIIINGFDLKK